MTPEQVRSIAREIGSSNDVADYLEKVMQRIIADRAARVGQQVLMAAKGVS